MHEMKATYIGLHKWTEKVFEIFGWMLLAKERKDKLKIDAYLDGLDKLEYHLKDKMKTLSSVNKKNDLEILLEKVKILSSFAKKHLRIKA
jgi:hypothetical protein